MYVACKANLSPRYCCKHYTACGCRCKKRGRGVCLHLDVCVCQILGVYSATTSHPVYMLYSTGNATTAAATTAAYLVPNKKGKRAPQHWSCTYKVITTAATNNRGPISCALSTPEGLKELFNVVAEPLCRRWCRLPSENHVEPSQPPHFWCRN